MAWYDINGLDDERLVGAVLPVKNSVGPQYQETHTILSMVIGMFRIMKRKRSFINTMLLVDNSSFAEHI
jgi:hypothetical protein